MIQLSGLSAHAVASTQVSQSWFWVANLYMALYMYMVPKVFMIERFYYATVHNTVEMKCMSCPIGTSVIHCLDNE